MGRDVGGMSVPQLIPTADNGVFVQEMPDTDSPKVEVRMASNRGW